MTSNIEELTHHALKLYLQIKSDTEKLKKLKNEILEKTSDDTKSISVRDNFFRIYKFKEKFRYLLNKKFNELSEAKQNELYDTGLLKVYYKINIEKYEKTKGLSLKNELDQYVEEKERPERQIAIFLGKETKKALSEGLYEKGDGDEEIEYLEEQIQELEDQLEEYRTDLYLYEAHDSSTNEQ